MAIGKCVLAATILVILMESRGICSGSSSGEGDGSSDSSSIPILASGKRQHNIMRFGKRPAGGHNLIHFGKREGSSKPPQHSFLYFGKRENERSLPELIQYLQNNGRDNSYKRGHAIMRFGKRDQGSHSFIRFGRRDDDADYDNYYPADDYDEDIDETKRDGHSMLYFGKRGGHSMMYFGKRGGHNMLSFGKREDGKRAHSMIHFGKRDDYEDDDDLYSDKRAHAMIHFGKKDYPESNAEEDKRGSHSMIHFGKREFDEEDYPLYWNPGMADKRQHNLLRFGKKTENSQKGSHSMIHFGKRENENDDKRAHSMIHFGKRSIDENPDSLLFVNNSDKNLHAEGKEKPINRKKREIEPISGSSPFVALIGYDANEDATDDAPIDTYLPREIYHPQEALGSMIYPNDKEMYFPDYIQPYKRDGSKNVFLRFG